MDKLKRKHFTHILLFDQERKLGDRSRLDTVVVLTINYVNWGLDENKQERLIFNLGIKLDCYSLIQDLKGNL